MFYDLFSNITIVVAFLFVAGQLFGKYPMNNKAPLRIRVILGVFFGGLGIILMLYSINVTSTIIVDLRNTAIISAAVIGGPVTVMIASALIAVFRVFHFGVNVASITGVLVALTMGAGCAFISTTKVSILQKFSYMLLYAISLSTVAFTYIIRDFYKLLSLFTYYIPITIFGVVLAYFAVEYIISRQIIEYELKSSNESLSESEEHFRTAFDHAAVGMALASIEGKFIRAYQPYCNMVGYTEVELQNKTFFDLTHPEDLQRNYEVLNKTISGDTPSFHIEKRYIHKDGHIIWVQVNTSVLHDREGNLKYYISQVQDITNRFMASEELKRINTELIEQRSDAERQRQEAMEANKYKGQFLATMSHELRTPLNSIIGFTNRVIKKSSAVLPQTQLENLEIVRDEAYHLLELINSLLDYSKIEAGKMEIYAEEFDLKDIIDEASTITKNIAESKHLRYRRQLPATDDILIYNDKIKVKQILINLLSNAFKYSEKGTVMLSVTIYDKFYRIEVKDEGIGISLEHIERIFEEFRQVDGTYTRKVGGTGLGLSITKRFVEMLGGRIEVQSKLGEGSKFTVFLPIRYSDIVDV